MFDIVFLVSIVQPADYCEAYPVDNYTLVVRDSLSDETVESMSATHADNFTFTGNLSDNTDYSFKILVANSVGIVSTNDTHFCKLPLGPRTIKSMFFTCIRRHY